MRKLVAIAALFLCACPSGTSKPPPGAALTLNDVIRRLGADGRACAEREGRTFCVSKDTKPYRALVLGDTLLPTDKLVFCLETEGVLSGCQAVADGWHCAEGVACRCTGVDGCATMVTKCGEDWTGVCGDCTNADCCCKAPGA